MSADALHLPAQKTNDSKAVCMYCKGVFLQPHVGVYAEPVVDLPLMSEKSTHLGPRTEEVNQFWSVKNMYDFDNMGFSNTVGNIKYLVCADCEMGPVGYYDIATEKCYLAIERVEYQ